MIEKKLLIRYLTEVYSDGTIKTTELLLADEILRVRHELEEAAKSDKQEELSNDLNLTQCSARIGQILAVIKITNSLNNKIGIAYINQNINKAVTVASQQFAVSNTSVIDKCSRQLRINDKISLKMIDFKKLVKDFLINGETERLETILIANVADKKGKDQRAITMLLANPNITCRVNNEIL